jgi:cytochrome c-type biogenesis protein CcmH
MRGWACALLLMLLVPTPALADSSLPPDPLSYTQLPDARKEAAATALMHEIRCVVCQGQSVADSDAELAGDMRALIRRRIDAGETPDAIRRWLVQRYGAWITYEPPLGPATWLLWAAPALFLILGLIIVRGRLRRRKR